MSLVVAEELQFNIQLSKRVHVQEKSVVWNVLLQAESSVSGIVQMVRNAIRLVFSVAIRRGVEG